MENCYEHICICIYLCSDGHIVIIWFATSLMQNQMDKAMADDMECEFFL